ncbi:amidohydrolase [Streptomyces sp. NPDC085927]|uniref:amidohydrolase n=1 Tax=Streptomyces sp. NPDC085927 TaxID=3365738 RepID=UPI0037D69FD2
MTAPGAAAELAALYRDLHTHPELAFRETRTAGIVADRLRSLGYDTTTGIGGTGVVGLLRNGDGPTALLRADMDALPVREETGLPYASTASGTDDEGRTVPLMHACGHDMHVTCLLGAAAELAGNRSAWRGTALLVFQPAEEVGRGARAMVDDGLYERFGRPAVVLGQHVAPLPAGFVGLSAGPAFAASDSLRIVLHGRGGHGSRPETTVDPVLMASATVMRLQGVVSREVAGTSTAVLTVGALNAGTRGNVIAEQAELLLNVRTYEPEVRDSVLAAIERIARAEASASGAPREPDISLTESFPAVLNDTEACARTRRALAGVVGADRVVDPGPGTGSEDVGILAHSANAPCAYWLLGGADPRAFSDAQDFESLERVVRGLPSNHSPRYAPVVEPTLSTGVRTLVTAAHTWMPAP